MASTPRVKKKTLSAGDLRAFRSMRQGLDGSLAGRSPAEVLERTGWVRSVGGASPYLALFARAGTLREAADAALAAVAIHELPSARGCTYVVPANGRLDQQRYAYARGRPSPLEGVQLSDEQVAVELPKRFYRWAALETT